MSTKKKETKPTAVSIAGCSVQMGPAKIDPPSEAAIVAIARAAERLADALHTLAKSTPGAPVYVQGHDINIGNDP